MQNDLHDAFAFDSAASASFDSDFAFQQPQQLAPDTPKITSDTHPKPGLATDYLWRGLAAGVERGLTGIGEAAADVQDFIGGNVMRAMTNFEIAAAQKVGLEGLPAVTYKDGKFGFGMAHDARETLQGNFTNVLKDHGAFDTAIPEADRTGAKLVQGIAAFMVPMSKMKAGLEAAEAFSNWGKVAGLSRDIAASAGAAFAQWHPLDGNLALTCAGPSLPASA